MPCIVPFSNKNLDVSFFALRPTGVFVEELIGALKYFSFHAEDLGCVYSSILKSIHGNLIIWYGAWIKRSNEDRKKLSSTLVSALARVSSMAILIHHGFFNIYVGESRDGHSAARFSSGDTICMGAMVPTSGHVADLSYTCLALLRSYFDKVDGVLSSVCLQCQEEPMVVTFQVWKSLDACYSWLLNSEYRKTIHPYISHHTGNTHFDVFKVVYVSNEEVLSVELSPPPSIESSTKEQRAIA